MDYQFEPSVDELAYGRYGELHLPGMQLTCSDFAITQTYHSCSNHNIAWLICLPLVGQIDVRHGYLHDSDYHTLTADKPWRYILPLLHVIHQPPSSLIKDKMRSEFRTELKIRNSTHVLSDWRIYIIFF